MQLQRLRLKGFIGIQKGMGRDEIELNLSGMKGLVALDGPNGHGKTSILDNLHPYRCLASRNKSLQHHVFLRDSVKELDFVLDGDHYRTVLKIDAQSERQEAFIYKNGNDASETNGKVSEYDQYINRLFGSSNLFFSSVFCAQNSKKICDLTTGELKQLFSEFLRLDELEAHEKTSKRCVEILSGRKALLGREIEKLRDKIARLNATPELLSNKTEMLESQKAALLGCKGRLEALDKQLADEKDVASRNDLLCRECDSISKRIIEIRLDARKEKNTANDAIAKRTCAIAGIETDISELAGMLDMKEAVCAAEKTASVLAGSMGRIEKDIDAAQSLLNKKNAERQAAAMQFTEEVHKLHSDINRTLAEEKAINEKLALKKTELVEAKRKLSELETGPVLSLRNRIAVCREKVVDLGLRDPKCTSRTCSFILGALEAEKELEMLIPRHDALRKEIDEREKNIRAEMGRIEKDINALTSESALLAKDAKEQDAALAGQEKRLREQMIAPLNDAIMTLEQNVSALKKNLKDLEKKRAEAENLAAKRPSIDNASSTMELLRKRQAEIKAEIADIEAKSLENSNAANKRAAELEQGIESLAKRIDHEVDSRIQSLTALRDELREKTGEAEDRIAIITPEITLMRRDIADKERAQMEMSELSAMIRIFSNEISEWSYLKNACSKDGLRALEIDSVAPVISGTANDLLCMAFDPTFSIRLRTQDDATGREVLDILVLRQDGTEALLENLSGGEKVWCLKALRLAMTLTSKEKSGKNFQSGFADEEDGALDVENALKFVRLYKRFMELGRFDAMYFISHKPECVSMADHVLTFRKGGISID